MSEINLDDFSSANPKIKYSCAKKAMMLAKENPILLYSDWDFFVKLLDSENNIMRWTGIRVIGYLSAADTENKIDKLTPKLFELFHDERMITSANTIAALAEIAKNKPQYSDKIIEELLQVEKMIYKNKGEISSECRNIAIGHLLDAIKLFDDHIKKRHDVIEFIERQRNNSRPSVSRRAKEMFDKISE